VYQDDPQPIRAIAGGNWYPRRAVARRGEGFAFAEYHPDQRVERLRWLICEGELMQAVARCRYVRHPVQVTILSRTPLPLRIDEVVTRHRLHPDWRRFNEGKILPLSARELVRLFPGAFSDTRSAKREAENRKAGFYEDRKALLVEYRREGARGPANKALVDGWGAIRELGKVKQAELVDDARNHFSVAFRDMRDALAREPLEFDLGEIYPDDKVEVADQWEPLADLWTGSAGPKWAVH